MARRRIADEDDERQPNRMWMVKVFRDIDMEDVAHAIEYPKPLPLAAVLLVQATLTDLLFLPFAVISLIAPWRVAM